MPGEKTNNVGKIEKDDVRHAPESGEPTESISRAKPEEVQTKGEKKPATPGNPTIGEDRESGQTDRD